MSVGRTRTDGYLFAFFRGPLFSIGVAIMAEKKEPPRVDPFGSPKTLAALLAEAGDCPYIASFTFDTVEGRRRLLSCENQTDYRAGDTDLKEFTFVDFLVYETTFAGKPGDEPRKGLRIILYAPSGKTLSTSSDAVFRFLQKVTVLYGTSTLEFPITVKFVERQTSGGRSTYDVVIQE